MKAIHHYTEDHNSTSAKEIIPYLLEYISPKSVIDIGCGLAQWLKVFQAHGLKDVMGVDGEHVPEDRIYIDNKYFLKADLNKVRDTSALIGKRRFDLVLNLEVAEHLKPETAESFVEFLTSLGDTILFSAAIPGQTGENHFNEQPHTYWQQIFQKKGYIFLDLFREKLCDNANVNWWYAQNMFLVVNKDSSLCKNLKEYNGTMYVHPKLLDLYVRENERLQKELSLFKILSIRRLISMLIRKKITVKW